MAGPTCSAFLRSPICKSRSSSLCGFFRSLKVNCCGRFNTAPSPALNADCVTSPDSSRFECYATRDVAEGEQLFVPYARGAETGAEFVGQQGSLLQSDLLGHYGFTVPNDGSWGLAPE